MIRRKSVRLVAWREITERLRGRATWILTGFTTILAVALVALPSLINQPSGPTVVGLVGTEAQALGPTVVAAAKQVNVAVSTVNLDSEAAARAALTPAQSPGGGGRLSHLFSGGKAGIDVALIDNGSSATIEAYQTVPPLMAAVLRATLNVVHQRTVLYTSGVSASTLAQAYQPVPVTTVTLQPPQTDLAARRIAALAAAFLLMYGVAGYGTAVATGVAQEKTSRTAELLIAALKPRELLIGKVLGIGLVGLLQMVVTIGAAMLTNALVKSTVIPSGLETFLPVILLWFVLGFALYAFAFAAAGALVARQEELQSVTLPFTALLGVSLIFVYATIANPDSVPLKVLSFLPPLSPVLMPARLLLGHTAGWELPVAVAIELAAIAWAATFAGRIYQAGLVRGGPRLSWGEALRVA